MDVLELFIWSLKTSLILTLVYLSYSLLFRKNTRFHLKRVILMVILATAVITPFLRVNIKSSLAPQVTTFQRLENVIEEEFTAPTSISIPYTIESTQIGQKNGYSIMNVLLIAYKTGLAISLGLLLFNLGRLLYSFYSGVRRYDIGNNVIAHKGINSPFSFLKWIFIPTGTQYDKDIWEIIEKHEATHLSQLHSLDLLLCSVVKCLLWYNPFIYKLQTSLRENHESLADKSVLNTTDLNTYASALLGISINSSPISLGHSFAFKPSLSKRIKDMKNHKTHPSKTIISSLALLIITSSSFFTLTAHGQTDTLKVLDNAFRQIMVGIDLDGQNFNTEELYKKHGKFPDSWLFSKGSIFPIVLLERHQTILSGLKEKVQTAAEGQSSRRFRISLIPTINLDDQGYYIESGIRRFKPELMVMLTEEDRLAMYELTKSWHKTYAATTFPDYPLVSELDFMSLKYLSIRSFENFDNPLKYGIKKIFKERQVDNLPIPFGGMDRFLKNVIDLSTKDLSVNSNDLPRKIKFEFLINRAGIMSMLTLDSKVNGSEEKQDRVYKLLKEINNSLIKVSGIYGWNPGLKDGEAVNTRMTIEIPNQSFLSN